MGLPRIILVVPLLLAGMFAPAVGAAPAKPPAHVIGMLHEAFARPTDSDNDGGQVPVKSVALRCGETLRMQNSSRWVHIIGPGRDGVLAADKAVPLVRRELLEVNDVYTTTAWTTPGTHYVTCAVHPEMTLKVVVTCCSRCASG
jgi:hypothetical protein